MDIKIEYCEREAQAGDVISCYECEQLGKCKMGDE